MDKKTNDLIMMSSILAISFFFAYMYKWNTMIENGTIADRTRTQRVVYLFTHSAVSALIGIIVFYGVDLWQPDLVLVFKMSLGAFGAVMSDFIIKGIGLVILGAVNFADKWVSK